MQIGYKLAAEAFDPQELIRQAVLAEAAGFDFVEISDHFHPWLDVQGHSPFAWTVLGAIAAKTDRIELATGVTCPTVRYHPAIIAQAAATLSLVSDGRFVLGVGSGERLHEHFRAAGGSGPGYAEAPLAWAPDEKTAAAAVLEKTRWALTGWKVMSELPNPVNFDAASATVREEDVLGQFACGPDVERHVEVVTQFTDAGFDRIALLNAGPDPDGFIDFFRTTLAPRLRGLEIASPSAASTVKGAVTGAVKAAVS